MSGQRGSKSKWTFFARSFDLNERKGIRSKRFIGSKILFQGNFYSTCVCRKEWADGEGMINEKTMINEHDQRAGTVAGGPLCMRSNSYDFPATVLGQSDLSLHPQMRKRRFREARNSLTVTQWESGRIGRPTWAFCSQSLCLKQLCCPSATLDSNLFIHIDYLASDVHQPRLNGERKERDGRRLSSCSPHSRNPQVLPSMANKGERLWLQFAWSSGRWFGANTWCVGNTSHLQKWYEVSFAARGK